MSSTRPVPDLAPIGAAIGRLNEFVTKANPRFRCRGVGQGAEEDQVWTASLRHGVGPPAAEADLEKMRSGYGNPLPEEFFELYAAYDGIRLYEDTVQNAAGFHTSGIYIGAIADWPQLTHGAQSWLDILDPDEEKELVPAWTEDAVVFGEVPNSGNYFIVGMSGDHRGKIGYFNHDGFEFEIYADTLADFLDRVTTDPANMLYELGCYARYADGKTLVQWIPESYETD